MSFTLNMSTTTVCKFLSELLIIWMYYVHTPIQATRVHCEGRMTKIMVRALA